MFIAPTANFKGVENFYNIDVLCINCNEMINVDCVGISSFSTQNLNKIR